jgi:hypothetical protein
MNESTFKVEVRVTVHKVISQPGGYISTPEALSVDQSFEVEADDFMSVARILGEFQNLNEQIKARQARKSSFPPPIATGRGGITSSLTDDGTRAVQLTGTISDDALDAVLEMARTESRDRTAIVTVQYWDKTWLLRTYEPDGWKTQKLSHQ